MKTIIIEDENAAVRNLILLLKEVKPDAEIVTVLDSIADTIEWFATHPMPEIIFMDIHLADGSAFEIFNHCDITCPVIFTTAYDEYALRAFKVNSIDYLLKPIDKEDIRNAYQKLEHLHSIKPDKLAVSQNNELLQFVRSLKRQDSYKTHFLVPIKGDKLLPVSVESIHFFYVKDGLLKVVINDGTEHNLQQTLEEVSERLSPDHFFRVNRQYLISKEAIKDIDLWFNSRLSINLYHSKNAEKILVSKARVGEFKEWFSNAKYKPR